MSGRVSHAVVGVFTGLMQQMRRHTNAHPENFVHMVIHEQEHHVYDYLFKFEQKQLRKDVYTYVNTYFKYVKNILRLVEKKSVSL